MIELLAAAAACCLPPATGGAMYDAQGRASGRVVCQSDGAVVVRDSSDRVIVRLERRQREVVARGPDGRVIFTLR